MTAEILIDAVPGESRAALVVDGRLVELMIDRESRTSLVGSVFLGRVQRVLPGMQAAFIDIGLDRAGFINLDGARPPDVTPPPRDQPPTDRIGDYLTEGQAILVQVAKDPVAQKGPQVTRRVALPGRTLVLTPGSEGVSVSRRIGDEAERDRLSTSMAGIVQPGEGFILRTNAAGASAQEMEADAEMLRAAWDDIEIASGQAEAPARLHAGLGALPWFLCEHGGRDVTRIRVDDAATFAALRSFCQRHLPALEPVLESHAGPASLFETEGIEDEIERALTPRVGLPSGGNIVIEQTEAMTVIDVNSASHIGRSRLEETALDTDLEAADECMRQLRLRGIGGLVVVDFIHLDRDANWDRVLRALAEAAGRDRTPTRIFGRTAAGLVEMTRRRSRETLARILTPQGEGATTPPRSPETIAFDLMRALRREARTGAAGSLTATASPAVIDFLEGPGRDGFGALVDGLGRKVSLVRDAARARPGFDIVLG